MSDTITIGIDHGYYAMKTSHFSFPTGLVEYEHEPYTSKDVLEYGGKYYVVGSGRQPLQKDKTLTGDYYLLTLAAIAKELMYRGAEPAAAVHLAAGLPLTSFGRDKKKFRAYLLRDGKPVSFRYEGQDYTVTIAEVSLFPQGYAAVLTQSELLDEPSVIVADIGGWTVDLMRLDNRIPNAATCRSLELGMIRCIDEISEQVRRLFGVSMTTAQIESVLRGSTSSVEERIRAIPAGQRTDAVCRMICQAEKKEKFLNDIRTLFREELRSVEFISAKEKSEWLQAGDVDESVLGFLLALQQEEGDTPDPLF